MGNLLMLALFGFIGGLVRAVLGLLKHYSINKKTKFKINYLIITLIGSAIIGMFASLAITTNYTVSLISGYMGIDVIENLVKVYKKKLNF